MIEKSSEWAFVKGVVRIRANAITGDGQNRARSPLLHHQPQADAARLNAVIRQHWGIENKLHWVLDVGFGEDLDRKRAGHSAQNFSLLNRIALTCSNRSNR